MCFLGVATMPPNPNAQPDGPAHGSFLASLGATVRLAGSFDDAKPPHMQSSSPQLTAH